MPWLKRVIKRSPIGELLRRRHVLGVGLPKAGTESLARLFGSQFRAAHEPRYKETIALALSFENGSLSPEKIRNALKDRDRELRLDCEASHIMARFSALLVDVFPKAQLILTVRHPLTWLDSEINQCMNWPRSISTPGFRPWLELRDLNYGPIPASRPQAEQALADFDLHSLDGMLAYWNRHLRAVLDSVPTQKLLVIRVEDLSNSLVEIARFVRVPESSLAVEMRHSHKAPTRHSVLSRIPQDYLSDKIEYHCGELTRRFYGDWEAHERSVWR